MIFARARRKERFARRNLARWGNEIGWSEEFSRGAARGTGGSARGLSRARSTADGAQLHAADGMLPVQTDRADADVDAGRSAAGRAGGAGFRSQGFTRSGGGFLSAAEKRREMSDLCGPALRLPDPFLRGGGWALSARRSARFDSSARGARYEARRVRTAGFAGCGGG